MKKRLPFIVALLTFAVVLILIRPWGNYPVNDDWQYAHVAKVFAETGRFFVDVQIAPSLVGQTLAVAPLIRMFGFSHLLLRGITIFLSVLLLLLLDRILVYARVGSRIRTCALLLVVFNPLFLHLSTSFMTEIYGYCLAMSGAWIWFRGRKKADERAARPLIGWGSALGSAIVIGASFWIRQFCVCVFPALVFSMLASEVLQKNGKLDRLRASFNRLLVSGILFITVIIAYFPWSKMGAHAAPQFSQPLRNLLELNPKDWLKGYAVYWIYMTAFLFPLLLLFSWRRLFERTWIKFVCLGMIVEAAGLIMVYRTGSDHYWPASFFQNKFPLLTNIIYDAGVGPITLTDTYIESHYRAVAHPHWPSPVWWVIYFILFSLTPVWIGVLGRMWEAVSKGPKELGSEVILFGLAFSLGMTGVSIEAFHDGVFDRYHFPTFLGMLLACAVLVHSRKKSLRPIAVFCAILPMAVFSVAGLHDYFRWNDVRWDLVDQAKRLGIAGTDIDGGYEVGGWFSPSSYVFGAKSEPFRITMSPTPGYRVLKVVPVKSWLAPMPPILFQKKTD